MTKTQGQNGRDGVRAGLTSAKVVSLPGAKSKASGKRIESQCGRFFCDAHGLFRKASDNSKTDMKLSGPVWIIAETRGADGKGWGILRFFRTFRDDVF